MTSEGAPARYNTGQMEAQATKEQEAAGASMQAIVVGCGRVGVMLAQLLDQAGHRVTIVDKNPTAFRRLGSGFRGRTVTGVGFDRDVLRAAGAEQAHGFAAVTSGDNSNFIAATVALDTFRVPVVVARVYDPQREQIYRRLGIHTISTTVWGAHQIKQLLLGHAHDSETLGSGEVQVVRTRISDRAAGRSVGDFSAGEAIKIFAIVRQGRAFVPTHDDMLQAGDVLHLSVATEKAAQIEALLR